MNRLVKLDRTPMFLTPKRSICLPVVVLEGEEDRLATHLGDDALDGSGLLSWSSTSLAITATATITIADLCSGRPPSLQVVGILARAKCSSNIELATGKLSGLTGLNIGVEEGVDVKTNNIDGVAKGSGVRLPDIEWLGSGDWTIIFTGPEGSLGGLDEGSEFSS